MFDKLRSDDSINFFITNGEVKMVAKNYYIQSGNLKNISVVIGELKNNETKYGIFI